VCYVVKAKALKKALQEKYHAVYSNTLEELPEHETVSGFAHPRLPVLTSEEPGIIQLMEWGLVPNWVKDERTAIEMQNATLNARSETLFEKPSFRSIMQRRCLIPVNGFYEWQQRGKKKVQYFITVKSEEIFSLGGLYDEWVNTTTGEIYKGFSIITLPANPLMEIIHNNKKRMPLILNRENEHDWLQPDIKETEIKNLLTQYPDSDMSAEEYSTEEKPLTLF
jgi:putative SOS response-associated peptidase YedK